MKRLQFVNAIVIGKLLYSLPIYTQLTKAQLNKIYRVIMSSAQTIEGNYCFKKSAKLNYLM